MTDEAKALVEWLRALHVWPQAIADGYADLLTPRQIEKLYEVGRVSHEAADLIETQAREIERLRAALKLAANRLERNAVDYIAAGDPHAYEQSEWADEARRAALAGDSHD